MSLSLSFPLQTYTSSNKPSVETLKSDLSSVETEFNSHVADTTIHLSASSIYPVGCVYTSVVATNPASLFGFGTWVSFGAGKVLVGLDSTDTDFNTAQETGGAKTATIAQANLPNISTGAGTAHTHIQTQHRHGAPMDGGTDNSAGSMFRAESGNTRTAYTNYETPVNQDESAHTHSLGGSGTAMSIMNPYVVVYFFKRTA